MCLVFDSLRTHTSWCHTAAIWAQIAPAISQRETLLLLVQENTLKHLPFITLLLLLMLMLMLFRTRVSCGVNVTRHGQCKSDDYFTCAGSTWESDSRVTLAPPAPVSDTSAQKHKKNDVKSTKTADHLHDFPNDLWHCRGHSLLHGDKHKLNCLDVFRMMCHWPQSAPRCKDGPAPKECTARLPEIAPESVALEH